MTQISREYEQFVQRVIRELIGVEVHRQRTFLGRVSHREIKVDLSFTLKVAGAEILVVIECKRYNKRVPVDDVEEFHSKIDDICAHKGILVTTVGFQDGAIKTAQGRGIALALLTDQPQRGELSYVVNSAGGVLGTPPPNKDVLLQGNIRGPLDSYDGGIRFDSFGQLLGILSIEFWHGDTNPKPR